MIKYSVVTGRECSLRHGTSESDNRRLDLQMLGKGSSLKFERNGLKKIRSKINKDFPSLSNAGV